MLRLDSRGVFLALVGLGLILPVVALVVVCMALMAQAALAVLHLMAGARNPEGAQPCNRSANEGPLRFSVHIAAHEEPAELVMRTVLALSRQVDAPAFEVIVLDNNTRDPALWQPVEALCRELGPEFRFYHEEGVKGAKAGALNIALARTDPRATHIVVVDADYEVAPDFLAVAAEEIHRCGAAFIQFPQAYRSDSGEAAGISLELADYFLRHARRAETADAMLLTGTLSVIARGPLEAIGGWSDRTITEDAELGLRLRQQGYRGRYIDRVVGRGLLPLDLAGLTLQRYRWASGNLNTIRRGLSGLSLRAAVHVVAQLTAWASLALPFAAGLIGGGLRLATTPDDRAAGWLASASGFGLALVFATAALPLLTAMLANGRPGLGTVWAALSSRIALLLPSAAGTVDALLGRAGAFCRTSKDVGSATDRPGAVLPALALAGMALLAVPGMPLAGLLGAVLLILPYPLARATCTRLSVYRASLVQAQA
ncbi:glycosyltransferase family 2 protein [Oceanicola sp. 502str15]|uniref:glycosyltransferase family 2 protein n=1 Tax=Oceanicola sp. 502str15 TaxID=2696061 RepID=UPI0020957F9C|nr:glycosyltransferase family 2 protein [Oceanicola sp. 502str15]MCO6383349.1 glycosyltransferase [Oceanicola sp. 502str15]